jgi:hypothetical protein
MTATTGAAALFTIMHINSHNHHGLISLLRTASSYHRRTMADDCEGTVREVAKVYELIKTHQPLFLLQPAMTTHQMAQHLLSEALRALNIALSAMTVMQKQQAIPATASSPLPVKPTTTSSTSARRSSKRKRYCT